MQCKGWHRRLGALEQGPLSRYKKLDLCVPVCPVCASLSYYLYYSRIDFKHAKKTSANAPYLLFLADELAEPSPLFLPHGNVREKQVLWSKTKIYLCTRHFLSTYLTWLLRLGMWYIIGKKNSWIRIILLHSICGMVFVTTQPGGHRWTADQWHCTYKRTGDI